MEQKRKLIIKKVDKYELHFENDCTYYSAKDKQEMLKTKKKLEEKEKERIKEKNNQEIIDKENNENIMHNLDNFIKKLKKDYWHLCRDREASKYEKNRFKETIDNLKGILNRKLDCIWHQSYVDDSTYYSIEKVKQK